MKSFLSNFNKCGFSPNILLYFFRACSIKPRQSQVHCQTFEARTEAEGFTKQSN